MPSGFSHKTCFPENILVNHIQSPDNIHGKKPVYHSCLVAWCCVKQIYAELRFLWRKITTILIEIPIGSLQNCYSIFYLYRDILELTIPELLFQKKIIQNRVF